MAALGFDLGPPPVCYTPRMATFGRRKPQPQAAPKAPEAPEATTPEPEIIGGMAISIDGRTSIVGGTPRHTPTHDDEW